MLKHPAFTIITDPVELAEFKKVIEEKTLTQQAEREELVRKGKERKYAERYKNKDQSVIPLILKIFEEKDTFEKGYFYGGLSCIITEPEILHYIYADIHDRNFFRDVIEYILLCWPAGSDAVMKAYLSTPLIHIDANYLRRIICLDRYNYILLRMAAVIKDPLSTTQEVNYLLSVLAEVYFPNFPPHIANQISGLLYYAYKHQLCEVSLMQCLQEAILQAGDEWTIALANELYGTGRNDAYILLKLFRLEGRKHLDKWYDLLKRDEAGANMILFNTDPLLIPEDLLKDLLIRLSGNPAEINMDTYVGIIRLLQEAGAERLIIEVASFVDNKEWCERLLAVYAMLQVPPQHIVDDLVIAGLLLQPLTPEVIEYRKANFPSDLPYEFIYQAMAAANRFFDYGGSISNPYYYGLFKDFHELSRHVLTDFGFYCDDHDVMLKTDTTGYILHHAYFKTDEEIIPFLIAFMNDLCAAKNRPERFIEEGFDFGNPGKYVFVDPVKLEWLKSKYLV